MFCVRANVVPVKSGTLLGIVRQVIASQGKQIPMLDNWDVLVVS